MRKGFTLIELLATVLIISILAAIALPQYERAVEHARSAEPGVVWSSISKMANMGFLERLLNGDLDTCDIWYQQAGLTPGQGHLFTSKYFSYENQVCSATTVTMQATRTKGEENLYTVTYTLTKNPNLELVTAVNCQNGTLARACNFFH